MTPEEFIDENYFSLTIDCKREINEIYKALKDYAKVEQLTLTDVVVPKGTLCDVCGSENTITVSHKGENCDWCNPL